MQHKIGIGLMTLGCMLVLLFFALMGFERVVYRPSWFIMIQSELQVHEDVGVSEDTLKDIQLCVGNYIHGDADERQLNPTVLMHGIEQPIFNEREVSHMRDVQNLFFMQRQLYVLSMYFGMVLLAVGYCLAPTNRPPLFLIATAAIGAWALLALLYFAWCQFSFDLMFTRFHELLFDNDLWLLDPNTDAMIRMYPLPFFEKIAGRIGMMMALYAVVPYFAVFIPYICPQIIRSMRRRLR